jgi:hypothetical protein
MNRAASDSAFVGAAVLLATTFWTLDARAYCRGVTASAPPGYDPALDGCFAPAGAFNLYWKNLCVGYSVQRDASSLRHVTLAQATQAAAQAFAAWSGVSCAAGGGPGIRAEDLGPVECDMVQYNSSQPNQHVIIFRDGSWPYDDPSNTVGLTTITYDATDGEIFDADTEVNTQDFDLVASGTIPDGSYDLASVLTHEAGHFLGLAHSRDTTAVMYAHYPAERSALTVDDEDGVCSVYPPGGGRVTSSGAIAGDACDATPRHGFSSACASPSGGGAPSGSAASKTNPWGCSLAEGATGVDARGPIALVALGLLGWLARARPGNGAKPRTTATTPAPSVGHAGHIDHCASCPSVGARSRVARANAAPLGRQRLAQNPRHGESPLANP